MACREAAGDGGEQLAFELERGHAPEIRAAEHPAAGCEDLGSECREFPEVLFHAEDLAFFVAGEGGWVEDDAVEGAALFGEAPEPVEGIAFAEVV